MPIAPLPNQPKPPIKDDRKPLVEASTAKPKQPLKTYYEPMTPMKGAASYPYGTTPSGQGQAFPDNSAAFRSDSDDGPA